MKQRLMNDLKDAMKSKDVIRKNVIQGIRASILQFEKDKQLEADENTILEIIQHECKKRQDTLESIKDTDRTQLVEDTQKELDIIKQYLPEPLSNEQLDENIETIIGKLNISSVKEMGKLMKECKNEMGLRVDGRTLSEHVKSILQTKFKGV